MCGNFFWRTNQEFFDWLFQYTNFHFTAFAHIMKSYDGYFFLNYIVIISNMRPTEKVPDVLLNDGKILLIKLDNITIKDGINFIPIALAKLPKT